jgi:hypothetical protein
MHPLLLCTMLAAAAPASGAGPAIPPAAAVGHPAPATRSARRVLVLMQLASPDIALAVSLRLRSLAAEEVPEARIHDLLRLQFRGTAGWAQAQEARRSGLDAEQNLDLDAAIAGLIKAREALVSQGAVSADPEDLAQVRLELAQCQDEKGDLAATQAELRRWAELRPGPLDPRVYPPALVALARQAQAEVAAPPPALPLAAIWGSGAVDEVVMVGAAGLPGAEDAVLLHYGQGRLRPDRVASVTRVGPAAEQQAGVETAVNTILGAGGASQVGPTSGAGAAPEIPVRGAELSSPIILSAGFAFPYAAAFSRYGVGTLGVGLSLGGRVSFSAVELGGRVDLLGGNFGIAQLTPIIRRTWHKQRVTFDLEPGLFLQIRSGCTRNDGCGNTTPTLSGTTPPTTPPTYLLFGAELGAGVGYQLSESWSLEEQFTLGVIMAANYDLNAPYGFQTRVAYTF